MNIKPKVAFVCTHNSCRSQMAEAIGKTIAADAFDVYSAGTEIKNEINPDAVETIKKLYGIDMTQSQYPKLLQDIPSVDVVITMGCGVQCPFLPCKHREDWGLEDPTGKSEENFLRTADRIKAKITELKAHISDYL
ncbi:MAG TPA: arsenate reductase ArsC [Caproiciproducens sp.]|nr:arsenate reductase ArsC [Caproiciproducens sp.]